MASVQAQTAVEAIEHLVLPDYVGRGIDGMFASMALYRDAVHGEYVHVLADDDVLAADDAVEALMAALGPRRPPLVLATVEKAGGLIQGTWPPTCGAIDLGNMLVQRAWWQAHCHRYGRRYEGDFDFAAALEQSGAWVEHHQVLLLRGAVSRGRPEVAA